MIAEKKTMVKPKFTEEQLKFIKHKGSDSVVLSSTAGSGKTSSVVGRLLWLLNNNVRPDKIICFSFTNDAVDELKARIKNPKVHVTTIHSFCMSVLAKSKKFKKIADFHHFVNWFKKKYMPNKKATAEERVRYRRMCERLEDEGDYISSQISKYKILKFENEQTKLPDFYNAYTKFLIETRSRDFVDMLIDVYRMLDSKSWENNYQYVYDYVFIDEYQDTSGLQMQILLALKAKIYHLIGDRNQSIYGFSGANCAMIEKLLKQAKPTVEYKLSINFRSDISIVEHANKYSDLTAVPNSKSDGSIQYNIIDEKQLFKLIETKPVTILARTNAVIKDLELKFLAKRLPIRYSNLLSDEELDIIRNGKSVTPKLNKKLKKIFTVAGKAREIIKFIDDNKESNSFITTIHKSKGREWDCCVVINSISPEVLELNGIELEPKETKKISFDPSDIGDIESKNIHYVAVTRPKHELYFMIHDLDEL